jgi:uncharacterized protein YecE (DUF72 family)
MPQTRIGISGWTYPPWRGVFYPKGLSQKRELEYASRQLNSIELNGSFYSLQRPGSYEMWHDATPDDFVFSLKAGRFLTHMKRLKEIEIPLANFLASGLLKLKKKLGPILWQLPPNFAFDAERFEKFFPLLPRDTQAMARMAEKHEAKMKGKVWTKADANRPLRHAIEVRHESFKDQRFIDLCRQHDVAIVVADTAGKWPVIEEFTSDFMYARLHGEEELYVSGYTDEAIASWARRIEGWRASGRDVFVYFDNDVKVRSPFDAMHLAARVAGREIPTAPEQLLRTVQEKPREHWLPLPAAKKRGTIKRDDTSSSARPRRSRAAAAPSRRVSKRRKARQRDR